jgi:hypothetical protein
MTPRSKTLVMPTVAFWFLLAAIASAAGVVRERWLVAQVGELAAHQAGTVAVSAAFLAAIAGFVRHFHLTPDEALSIGMAWLAGAVLFEFGFGHYVDGLPWARLLSDYDFTSGRLLLLLWIIVSLGPFLLARLLRADLRRS